jgi:hypothetical protein
MPIEFPTRNSQFFRKRIALINIIQMREIDRKRKRIPLDFVFLFSFTSHHKRKRAVRDVSCEQRTRRNDLKKEDKKQKNLAVEKWRMTVSSK